MIKQWQIFTLTMLSVVLLAGPVQAEKQSYYRWIDASGNASYGKTPPLNVDAVKVDIHTGRAIPTNTIAKPHSFDNKAIPQTELELEAGEAERLCGLAQANLTTLKGAGIIRMRNEEGEPVVLDDEAKQAQIDAANKAVDQYCDK